MKTLLTFFGILIFSFHSFGQIPSLNISDEDKKSPLEIAKLDVRIDIIGNVATTTYDILFYNPQKRILEGELSMPLGEGQEISRYALDINGNLREGVIIEKVKARQAFEAVTRQNIDPGIINITKGNFFKTRIYPIPARGNKRVVLAISETLTGDKENLYYSLPIETKGNIGEFNLEVKALKSGSTDKRIVSEFENIQFDNQNDAFFLSFNRKDFQSTDPIKFTIPRFGGSDKQLFTYEFEGKTYFYLNVKPPALASSERKQPEKIAIYWDNSASASKRDIEKELSLLKRYLNSLENLTEISLTTFSEAADQAETFNGKGAITSVLSCIRELRNDGATRIDNLLFSSGFDEILLFSDGINTIGEEEMKLPNKPIHAITSSTGSNYSLLKKLAKKTNGEFINLSSITEDRSLHLMQSNDEKFLSSSFAKRELEEVYPNTPQRVGEYFEIVGILKSENASIKINYGDRSGVTKSQTFEISKNPASPISRIWASKKIEALSIDYAKNRKAIFKLGQKHNIVTKNSSFIVLDRVEDYVEHEIIPPAELRKKYDKLIAKKVKSAPDPEDIFRRNKQQLDMLWKWYLEPPRIYNENKVGAASRSMDVEDDMVLEEVVYEEAPEQEIQVDAIYEVADAEDINDEIEVNIYGSAKRALSSDKTGPSIKVLAWLPDAPYLGELRNVEEEELEDLYFKLKEEHKTRPAFFIQVSDFFFAKGMNQLAVQVLSNVIELDLENPELLRVVAKRFLDEGEVEMSVLLFEEIKSLRPEEPQSYRDLALAHIENKAYQKALELFNHILEKQWDRFDAIKEVVLNELNNLLTLHGNELDVSIVNKEFIKSMPLDVRIVIDWSSNDNDVDLWVIDPNGEKCFYGLKNTTMGGKISTDFTQGYGPEEYSLKEAKRGYYTVYVNYFSESRQSITGPVTVYATLYTNYGKPNQKSERITVQLTDNKESRQIAQLEF